jgi:hypothetical protein
MHPDDLPAFEKKAGDLGVPFWSIGRFVAEPKGKILLT